MTARTLAWTGFLAIAAFALMVASRLTALDPVENLSLSVTAPVQNALHDATQPVADWVNDDQPYMMHIGGKRLCSIPYSTEINDLPQIIRAGRRLIYRLLNWTPWQGVFFRMLDQLRC